MVFFKKSQPAPKSLAGRRSYRDADVVERLRSDFKNKCYICEIKAPTSINVEHFLPHRGDRTLMYDWNNLFFACPHCNMTKEECEKDKAFRSSGILNCTREEDYVDECISYRVTTLIEPAEAVLEKADINAAVDNARIENTIKLLNVVYNGYKSPIKTTEAANLLNFLLLPELNSFYELILEYKKASLEKKESLMERILTSVRNDSAFAAFKRWIVRDDKELSAQIKEYLETHSERTH